MSVRIIGLTNLGKHAVNFGVQTPGDFWRQHLTEVERIADDGGDWEQMLQERIDGLAQLQRDLRDHGSDWFGEVLEIPKETVCPLCKGTGLRGSAHGDDAEACSRCEGVGVAP